MLRYYFVIQRTVFPYIFYYDMLNHLVVSSQLPSKSIIYT